MRSKVEDEMETAALLPSVASAFQTPALFRCLLDKEKVQVVGFVERQ